MSSDRTRLRPHASMVISPVTWSTSSGPSPRVFSSSSSSPSSSSSSSLAATLMCLSALSLMSAVTLMAVAFASDHWQELEVNDDLENVVKDDFRTVDRSEGLFHVCFETTDTMEKEMITVAGLSLDLFPSLLTSEWCFSKVDLVFGEEQRLTRAAVIWQTLMRLSVALFSVFFMISGIASVVGITACWQCSKIQLRLTAILNLAAAITAALALLVWHLALFHQNHRVYDARLAFRMSWPSNLQDRTTLHLGWCHSTAIVAIVLTFVSSIILMFAASAVEEKRKERDENVDFHSFHTSPSFYRPVRRHSTLSSTFSGSLSSRKPSRIDYYGSSADVERLNDALPRTATLNKQYKMVMQELQGNNNTATF